MRFTELRKSLICCRFCAVRLIYMACVCVCVCAGSSFVLSLGPKHTKQPSAPATLGVSDRLKSRHHLKLGSSTVSSFNVGA